MGAQYVEDKGRVPLQSPESRQNLVMLYFGHALSHGQIWVRFERPLWEGDFAPLFDDLVGAADYWSWDVEPERLGSLEIDDQLDLRGLLDG